MSEWGCERNEYCANCEAVLRGGNSAKSILSTWKGDEGKSTMADDTTPISIYEALSVIFEMGPLHPLEEDSKKDVYRRNGSRFGGEGKYFGLCFNCSERLANVYNSFQEFTAACKWGSEIGKILRDLRTGNEGSRKDDSSVINPFVKLEPPEVDDTAEGDDTANSECEDGQQHQHPPEFLPSGEDKLDSEDEEVSNSSRRAHKSNNGNPSSRNLLQCPNCSKQFLYETTLVCHRRIIHQEKIDSVPPPISLMKNKNSSIPPSGTLPTGVTSTCPICRLVVPRRDIRDHLSTHTRSHLKPWLCLICGKEFRNQMELYGHSEAHKTNIPCQNCGKKIPRLEMLSHIRICFPTRPFLRSAVIVSKSSSSGNRWSCKLCGINFTRRELMTSHMATHMQSKRHSCKICDRKFDRSDLLRLHVKRFHRNNEGPPSVRPSTPPEDPLANFDFSLPDEPEPSPGSASAINTPSVSGTNPKNSEQAASSSQQPVRDNRFLCNGCPSEFPKYSELEAHLMEAHTDQSSLTCSICRRQLQDTFCLKLHVKFHSTTKPFTCYICGVTYREKTNFFTHLKVKHALEENVIIEKYPHVFRAKSKYAMKVRMLKGQNLKGSPARGEFPCEVCGKVFPFMHSLNSHKKVVHDKIRDYICSYCGKSFARKSYFIIHEKLHTSTETPYKCHLCGKGFRLPGNLRSHLRSTIHNSERNFICDTCGKSFNRKDNLRLHIKSVHLKISTKRNRSKDEESRYTIGGRRRVYGADLPSSPQSQSDTSSSFPNMPSSSSKAEPHQHKHKIPEDPLGTVISVPVISHGHTQQHQSHAPFAQVDFSTVQHSQIGFTFPSYQR